MSQKYCSSCGSPIPDGQGSNCSMCYGDVSYGKDHYYEDMNWLLERMTDEENRQREEENESQNN